MRKISGFLPLLIALIIALPNIHCASGLKNIIKAPGKTYDGDRAWWVPLQWTSIEMINGQFEFCPKTRIIITKEKCKYYAWSSDPSFSPIFRFSNQLNVVEKGEKVSVPAKYSLLFLMNSKQRSVYLFVAGKDGKFKMLKKKKIPRREFETEGFNKEDIIRVMQMLSA